MQFRVLFLAMLVTVCGAFADEKPFWASYQGCMDHYKVTPPSRRERQMGYCVMRCTTVEERTALLKQIQAIVQQKGWAPDGLPLFV